MPGASPSQKSGLQMSAGWRSAGPEGTDRTNGRKLLKRFHLDPRKHTNQSELMDHGSPAQLSSLSSEAWEQKQGSTGPEALQVLVTLSSPQSSSPPCERAVLSIFQIALLCLGSRSLGRHLARCKGYCLQMDVWVAFRANRTLDPSQGGLANNSIF